MPAPRPHDRLGPEGLKHATAAERLAYARTGVAPMTDREMREWTVDEKHAFAATNRRPGDQPPRY